MIAEALDRVKITVGGGVPGLESRIEDPILGTIRILVAARPGETIRAEIVVADPAAASELNAALQRAMAAGTTLPAGVDLRIRAEAATRPSGADAHTGSGAGQHGQPATGHHQQPGDRRGDDLPAFAFGRDGSSGQPDTSPRGRERRPGSITTARAAAVPAAARSGSALDVRA